MLRERKKWPLFFFICQQELGHSNAIDWFTADLECSCVCVCEWVSECLRVEKRLERLENRPFRFPRINQKHFIQRSTYFSLLHFYQIWSHIWWELFWTFGCVQITCWCCKVFVSNILLSLLLLLLLLLMLFTVLLLLLWMPDRKKTLSVEWSCLSSLGTKLRRYLFTVRYLCYSCYRVCRGFRLTKQDDYFRVNFDHFWSVVFWGTWGSSKNWLEPKTLPP